MRLEASSTIYFPSGTRSNFEDGGEARFYNATANFYHGSHIQINYKSSVDFTEDAYVNFESSTMHFNRGARLYLNEGSHTELANTAYAEFLPGARAYFHPGAYAAFTGIDINNRPCVDFTDGSYIRFIGGVDEDGNINPDKITFASFDNNSCIDFKAGSYANFSKGSKLYASDGAEIVLDMNSYLNLHMM